MCRVVVGPDAVSVLRAESSEIPIVALVDAASPTHAVLAHLAGADIVLPAASLELGDRGDVPGMSLAVLAATVLAHRRVELARSSRAVSHDLAGALNVISLAAEVGTSGAIDPIAALERIGVLAGDAGIDAWRAGRAHRASSHVLAAVDVSPLVLAVAGDRPDVHLCVRDGAIWVLADERVLASVVTVLIDAAARWGPVKLLVDTDTCRPSVADIVVRASGPCWSDGVSESIAELIADLGASSDVVGIGIGTGSCAHEFRLSIPMVGHARDAPIATPTVDPATAQANVLEGVVRHAPLTESLDAIVAAIEHQLPDTACSILLLTPEGTLHHGAGARLPGAYREAIDGVAIGLGQGSCGTAAFTGQPVIASDVTTDPNWVDFREVAIRHGLRSCWSTPIVAAEGGEVLGTFAVYKTSTWNPDRASVRLVERFTYLAAVAIEHHRLFGALAESESRFRSAFEGATAGMALVELDGTLLKVNPALSAMLGPVERAIPRTNLLGLIDPDYRAQVTSAWDTLAGHAAPLAADHGCVEVPLAVPHAGERVWVSLRTSIITEQLDGGRYLCVEVRDVSADRRHLEEQRARKIAEASNQAKSDFLALVSHELRTPLNAILGFAQVMQMVDLDPEQHADGVDQIVRAGRHLRDLIDDLLDLSRIEAGQLSVAPEDVDPCSVIGEVLDLVRPLATSRNIELVADATSRSTTHRMNVDRRCVRQVLINLVGNAVKYTPQGGTVRVDVDAVSDEMVRIGVTDSGPGIAPDSIAELFQPFHRLERHVHTGAEGTGLGLALSARLTDEMHGRIGVESALGTGSCFWVELPRSGHVRSGGPR